MRFRDRWYDILKAGSSKWQKFTEDFNSSASEIILIQTGQIEGLKKKSQSVGGWKKGSCGFYLILIWQRDLFQVLMLLECFRRQMIEFKEVKLGKAKCSFFLLRFSDDCVNGNSKCIVKTISNTTCIRIKINLWKRKI